MLKPLGCFKHVVNRGREWTFSKKTALRFSGGSCGSLEVLYENISIGEKTQDVCKSPERSWETLTHWLLSVPALLFLNTLSSSWVPWSPSNLHLSNLTGGTYGEESLIHKASGHLYYTRRNRPLDFCRPWIYRCCISVWHYVICLAVCQHQWKILNAR